MRLAEIYHSDTSNTSICKEVDVSEIDRNSALLTVSSYVSSEEATYEQIDTDVIRQELAKQQKITDYLLSKYQGSLV